MWLVHKYILIAGGFNDKHIFPCNFHVVRNTNKGNMTRLHNIYNDNIESITFLIRNYLIPTHNFGDTTWSYITLWFTFALQMSFWIATV